MIRDKDLKLEKGEVIPFNKKMIINKIEETLGRGELEFATGVKDGKDVIVLSQKVLVD